MKRFDGFLVVVCAMTVLLLPLLVGCGMPNLSQGISLMNEDMQPITETLLDKLAKEGVLNDWMAQANAQGIEPGLFAVTRIEISTGIQIKGMSGMVQAQGDGEGVAFVPGEVMQFILNQASSGDEVAKELLGSWFANRAEWTSERTADSAPK